MNLIIVMQVSIELSPSVAAYACADDTRTEQSRADSDQGDLVGLEHAVALRLVIDRRSDAVAWGALLPEEAWLTRAQIGYRQRVSSAARLDIGYEQGYK